jgi:hypothetical protein
MQPKNKASIVGTLMIVGCTMLIVTPTFLVLMFLVIL